MNAGVNMDCILNVNDHHVKCRVRCPQSVFTSSFDWHAGFSILFNSAVVLGWLQLLFLERRGGSDTAAVPVSTHVAVCVS